MEAKERTPRKRRAKKAKASAEQPKRGPGRPPTITTELLDNMLRLLKRGADMALAAKACGVSADGVRRHLNKHPELKQAFDDARAVADEIVVNALYRKALSGDVAACIFWLKNRRRGEWSNLDTPPGAGVTADEIAQAFLRAGKAIDNGIPYPAAARAGS